MKSLFLLQALLLLLPATFAWRFVSKVEELPVEITDRLERSRPKVRVCGVGESEESTDCVLCTVCHPHEYELIGCSGQMDSVCASCTTGWMRNTPKTVDFFRKCKSHPQLPFLFPDISYPKIQSIRLESAPSSMFADQEKMLQDAENIETSEMDEEFSEETDDYDGEDEDEDEDTGVEPVVIDETDEDSQSAEADFEPIRVIWSDRAEIERIIALEMEKMDKENEAENVSVEDEDSMEEKEEERSDPFVSKKEEKKIEDKSEEESEELDHLVYPLHRANIWRIIGPEITKSDDKDISEEIRKEISERKEEWRTERGMRRYEMENRKILSSDEDDYADPFSSKVIGGYRPLPVSFEKDHYSFAEVMGRMDPIIRFVVILCCALVALIVVLTVKICFMKRRNRVIILPELDEISRQLINEAHARVHSNKYKKIKPEFV